MNQNTISMKLFISLVKKTIDVLVEYGKEIVQGVEASGLPELASSRSFIALKESYGKLVDGYNKERKSAYTEKLAALNDARKNSYRAMRITTQSFLYSEDEDEVSAAGLLDNLFKQNGTQFQNMSYSRISAQLRRLIESFSGSDAARAIALLKLYNKLLKLVNDEKAFEESYNASLEAKKTVQQINSATVVRKEFEKAMGRFTTYLEVILLENPSPQLESLCHSISRLNVAVDAHTLFLNDEVEVQSAAEKV